MLNFKPQKGKDYTSLPKKTLATFPNTHYLVSTKYDGHQIHIVKEKGKVRWFTSDWKEFDIPGLGKELERNPFDFNLMAEFNYDSLGKLGDRRKSAIITTLRTQFSKGLKNPSTFDESKCSIKVFECLMTSHSNCFTYEERMFQMKRFYLPKEIQPVKLTTLKGKEVDDFTNNLVKEGWEGTMCVELGSFFKWHEKTNPRVNYIIKRKLRPTADLVCIGWEYGEKGKEFEHMIGALILTDEHGRTVKVSSGLDIGQRDVCFADSYKGKVVEIQYEQIMDTYTQAVFKHFREDKNGFEN